MQLQQQQQQQQELNQLGEFEREREREVKFLVNYMEKARSGKNSSSPERFFERSGVLAGFESQELEVTLYGRSIWCFPTHTLISNCIDNIRGDTVTFYFQCFEFFLFVNVATNSHLKLLIDSKLLK